MEESEEYLRRVGYPMDRGGLGSVLSSISRTGEMYGYLLGRYEGREGTRTRGETVEGMTRMGVYGWGRNSGGVDVRAGVEGRVGGDGHYMYIDKMCEMILVGESLGEGREWLLGMCGQKEWIEKGGIFPRYIDGGEGEETEGGLYKMREMLGEYREMEERLEQWGEAEGEGIMDREGNVDYEGLEEIVKGGTSVDVDDIRRIGDSMEHLNMLTGKRIIVRDYEKVKGERTMEFPGEGYGQLKDGKDRAEGMEKAKWEAVGRVRNIAEDVREVGERYTQSKLKID